MAECRLRRAALWAQENDAEAGEGAASAAQAAPAMPAVSAFELPVENLVSVAQSSGLQWVNSDPQKIAAVQAAIAAEPAPAHVPRQRPAPVVLDDVPLVLVETKRDLGQMQLPIA